MGTKTIFGLGILFVVVVGNGVLTARLGGLTYSRFTWEAYAQVYGTPIPLGDPCTSSQECADGGVCRSGKCEMPAPAASGSGLVALLVLLLVGGTWVLGRRSPGQRVD